MDQGYTGEASADAAREHGILLEVMKHRPASTASCSCPAARVA